MTKRRAVQIFIVVGVMVLTGFISIFCMLTAITLFILNIYIRERHMRKRFILGKIREEILMQLSLVKDMTFGDYI